jgi:hypothetical protein
MVVNYKKVKTGSHHVRVCQKKWTYRNDRFKRKTNWCSTDEVLAMEVSAIWSFDWDVLEIEKGNDIEAIIAGMNDAKSRTEKENQFVYYCIQKWVMVSIYDVQSCMAWKRQMIRNLKLLWAKLYRSRKRRIKSYKLWIIP